MKEDLTLAEIREARWRISARFDHDPKRLVEHYIERQSQHRDRLISLAQPPEAAEGQEDRSPPTR